MNININEYNTEDVKVIIKNNDIESLKIFIKDTNKKLNYKDFDLLLIAINNSASPEIIKCILHHCSYKTLNYTFYPNQKYRQYFENQNWNKPFKTYNKEFEVPLFSSLNTYSNFDIADILIENGANINYLGNNQQDIITYLSSFIYISESLLKYILSKGFRIDYVTTELLSHLNYSNSNHLKILLEYCQLNNFVILDLLTVYKNKNKLTKKQLHYILSKKNFKFDIYNEMYRKIITQNVIDIDTLLLLYECDIHPSYEIINEILEEATKHDLNVSFMETILNKKVIDLTKIDFEKFLIIACECNKINIAKRAIEYMRTYLSPNSIKNSLEKALLHVNACPKYNNKDKYYNINEGGNEYFLSNRKPKNSDNLKWLIMTLLEITDEDEDHESGILINVSLLKSYGVSFLSLIINSFIKIGHLKWIKFLMTSDELKSSIDLSVRDQNGESPLFVAYYFTRQYNSKSYQQYLEIFNYLLTIISNQPENLKLIRDENNYSLLALAMKDNNYIAIHSIFQQNIELDNEFKEMTRNDHLIFHAICQNKLEDVKILFNTTNKNTDNENTQPIISLSNIKTHKIFNNEFDPLTLAYLLNTKEIFEFLLRNINFIEEEYNFYDILKYVILKEDFPIFNYLVNSLIENLFHCESYYHQYKTLIQSLAIIPLFISNKNFFLTLIHNKYFIPRTDLPSLIIKTANINDGDKVEMIENLIQKGYDVNLYDSKYEWPLLAFALKEKSFPVMDVLVEHGANVNAYIYMIGYDGDTEEYGTLLSYATYDLKDLSIIKYLIKHGTHIDIYTRYEDIVNLKGITIEFLEEIIQQNIKSIKINSLIHGNSVLAYAILNMKEDFMDYLIEHGADVHIISQNGESIKDICHKLRSNILLYSKYPSKIDSICQKIDKIF
ncbi:hypothetical protein LY90DRAFT_627478 [Neocallimastix californiae]|uniref:Uncharacterized protein n=1 Tax=Neocallimastix californiae TaxID=1754190 RepID=A0A1Y2B5D6_9FUNG|nr:hypothetical protein LY90DRAFT_627478 [Neocallimastix californiae]|eukprot:ORY30048.1 hypothetical protein LY90DRAFT_627478 [Neocallimastix californiae]